MSDPEQLLVEYREEDGIHIFTFHANSRQAVLSYLDQLHNIALPHYEANGNEPLYIVMDISEKGMFSLAYARTQMKNRDAAFRIPFYIAYLGNSDSDEFLMQLLSGMLPKLKNQRRIFTPDQLDAAIAWLRASGAPRASDGEA